MITFKQILVGSVLLIFVSCSQKDEFTERLGGKANSQNLLSSQKIIAWRTAGSEDNYDGYFTKTGMPTVVSPQTAEQLRKVLLDRNSYYIDSKVAKACALQPGVVVCFSGQNNTNNVFFCFECSALVIQQEGKLPFRPIDFNSLGYTKFVRIMKSIFPADVKIQRLQD